MKAQKLKGPPGTFNLICTTFFSLLTLLIQPTIAAETVIFEQFGTLVGSTSYMHVHITLSLDSLIRQHDTYLEYLEEKFNSTDAVIKWMTAELPISKPSKEDAAIPYSGYWTKYLNSSSIRSAIRNNADIYLKIVECHKRDLKDIYNNIRSLKNALPLNNGLRTSVQEAPAAEALAQTWRVPARDQIHAELYPDNPDADLKLPPIPEYEDGKNGIITATYNVTFTTTTRPPKKEPQPISPKKRLIEDLSDFSRKRFQREAREKRLAGIVALPLAVAATAMGLYNRQQINSLRDELFEAKEDTRRLFQVVQNFSQTITGIENSMNEIRTTLVVAAAFSPSVMDARMTRIENQLRNRVRRTTHAIQAAIHRRFAADYLNPEEMTRIFENIKIRAVELGCDLLIDYHTDLFQVEASLLYDGKNAHVLLHVPMAPKDMKLRLFRLHPFPLPMFDTHFLIPDVKNDILAISSTNTRLNVQLAATDLLGCHRVNQLFMCDNFGVLSRRFNNTCLGALYMQMFDEAQQICPFTVVPVEERVYQLKKSEFVVFLPAPSTIRISCRNGTHSELHLKKGTQRVTISPGCQGFMDQHLITSDYSGVLAGDIVHYDWDWEPASFMGEELREKLESQLEELGDLKIHRPDFASLSYMSSALVRRDDTNMFLSLISIGGITISVLICSFALWGCYRKKCCHNDEARAEGPTVRERRGSRAKRSSSCGAMMCCFHKRDSARRNETRVSWHRDDGDFVHMAQFPDRRPLPGRPGATDDEEAEYIALNTLPRAKRTYPPAAAEHRRSLRAAPDADATLERLMSQVDRLAARLDGNK
jgi:hypothetical protein